MNRYSRIFHHLTVEDVKRTFQHNKQLEKIHHEDMKKKELYMEEKKVILDGQKSNWRKDLPIT